MLPLIVAAIGMLIGVAGLVGVTNPSALLGFMNGFISQARLYVIAVIRLALGVVFLFAAPECKLTILVQITGVLALLSGITTAMIGEARARQMVEWFAAQPSNVLRLFSVAVIVFGAALVYAGT